MSANPSLSPTPRATPYLTIIPDRSPVQKVHTSLGHAKNALTYDKRREGTLWEWNTEQGAWELLYTVTVEYVKPPLHEARSWGHWIQTVPWREEGK